MTVHLLDANILIAATVGQHLHRDRVEAWFESSPGQYAVCPIVEGALVRFLLRAGDTAANAVAVLDRFRARSGAQFWADDVSYAETDVSGVRGHRQVTGAYLVALAKAHGGVLATLDEVLARAHPDATVLLPE